jgi:hypothetical protein
MATRRRKALLQSLVDEIRVVSRAEIFPSSLGLQFDHRNEQYRYSVSSLTERSSCP